MKWSAIITGSQEAAVLCYELTKNERVCIIMFANTYRALHACMVLNRAVVSCGKENAFKIHR